MQNVPQLLRQLAEAFEQDTYSAVEKERLAAALTAIYTRLEKGDYSRFSYTENVFDVPNRARDFFTELEFHCEIGRTWSQILRALDVQSKDHIADLCPGYNPKIEIGLFYAGYTGAVTVIDADDGSIEHLKKFMALFDPKFRIDKQIGDLFDNLAGRYDAVLGNHIIDDLIMYYYTKKLGKPLADIYASEDAMRQLWQGILSERGQLLAEIPPLIADAIQRLVKPGGYVCLTQYPSYMERMLSMPDVSTFNTQVTESVVERLVQSGFSRDDEKVQAAFAGHTGHFGPQNCYILHHAS